ncbi:MAG: hypothetical protein OEY78_13340 [Gammaproteobacteria bacterium]|nr:hypothetical protein [Gammaproteobacteria bacterium]
MAKELTLDLVQSQLRPNQRLTISEETVAEIQKLAEDPEYGAEFLDCYIDHLNIYKENPRRSHNQYLNAIKFFSLVEAGNSLTDAYIKLFPERFRDRQKNFPPDKRDKSIMRGEASRFNTSSLVNEIRKVAAIPVQLVHRHLLHEAILEQADLMRNARSEAVRQKAGECLIKELKPAEDHVLKVEVDDNTTSVIDELRRATEALAAQEHTSVLAGVPLKQIAEAKIIEGEIEQDDEAEYVEVIEDQPKKKWTMP